MGYYKFYSSRNIPRVDAAERLFIELLRANAKTCADKAKKLLQKYTPTGDTGRLKAKATTWGLHSNVRYGFYFWLGWRKSDFKAGKFYPVWVDHGTGVYGKYRRRIYPKKAKVLAWESPEYGFKVAKSIAGQQPQYMLAQAQDEWITWFFKFMEQLRVQAYRKIP